MQKRKIEPSEYPKILELYRNGLTYEKIAKLYGVARTSISYIMKKYYKQELDEIKTKDKVVKAEFSHTSKVPIPRSLLNAIDINKENSKVLLHLDKEENAIILKKHKDKK